MATFYIQLENKLLQISGDLTAENISKALGYVPGSSNFSGKFEDLTNSPFIVDGKGELEIADELGNVIAKIDASGLHSIDFIAGEHKLSEKVTAAALQGLATHEYVTNKIAEAQLAGKDVDLSGYATKSDLAGLATTQWVEGKGYLTEHQDITHLATKDEVYQLALEAIKNIPLEDDESDEFNIVDKNGNVGLKLTSDGLYVQDVITSFGKFSDYTAATKVPAATDEDIDALFTQNS